MNNKEIKIKEAYRTSKNIYDNVLTAKGFWAKAYNKIAWGMKDEDYVETLLSFIPNDFKGRLLDVPVGTAVFTCEKYAQIKDADIVALDYSIDMLAQAQTRFFNADIKNVACMQGDVGELPFEADRFDLVLSMNGFHAFPDKEKAFKETARVLNNGGIFCGCFYIKGQRGLTDFIVNQSFVIKGWFTPPFYDIEELGQKLKQYYRRVELHHIKSIAYFYCIK